MSRLDDAVRIHNEISDALCDLEGVYRKGDLHVELYENERVRLMYGLEDVRDVIRKSMLRTKDPVTLSKRLKSSHVKRELMNEIS